MISTRHSRRLSAGLLVLILGGAGGTGTLIPAVAVAADGSDPPRPAAAATLPRTDRLPAPFDQWDVGLAPSNSEPGALSLTYDSPRLGIRAVNSVYLPSGYRDSGRPSPVMYYLHGTVISVLDNPDLVPMTRNESLLNMLGRGGGYTQTLLQDFPSQADRAEFIVVAPDTDPAHSWCQTCLWINGRANPLEAPPLTAAVVPAEDVLLQEVIPLTEAVFHTRTDRGGRGIMGFSMGSVGAEIQGFRHPDLFSYIGGISGPFDIVDDPFWRGWLDTAGYFRDQGYGTAVTNAEQWRQFNPKDLAHHWKGVSGHLLISAGGSCAAPADAQGVEDCRRYPPEANPGAAFAESQIRRSVDEAIPVLGSLGIPAEQFRAPGVHGANNHRVYAEAIVPTANRLFAIGPRAAAAHRGTGIDQSAQRISDCRNCSGRTSDPSAASLRSRQTSITAARRSAKRSPSRRAAVTMTEKRSMK